MYQVLNNSGDGADGSCHRNSKEGKSDQYGLRDPKPISAMGGTAGLHGDIQGFLTLWPFLGCFIHKTFLYIISVQV